MCGRYVSVRADSDLLAEFDALDAMHGDGGDAGANGDAGYQPDYNVAPTKPVRIIVNRRTRDGAGEPTGDPVRQLRIASWGLVPSWAKDRSIGPRLINARSEAVASAPSFRRAYAARRCLVPADGWYEWRASAGVRKQPFYMSPPDGHVLAFAGLYEFWGSAGDRLTTTTIVTAEATGELGEIHDRMPLVLPRSAWARWLDPKVNDPGDLLAPCDEASGEHLELRPVGPRVGDYRNNGPDLIRPDLISDAAPDQQPQALF
jgi:putative SOS response-associated peptidase YedK